MHEASLVQALFDQADAAIAEHPSAAVRRVTVRIGALAGVEAELFRTAFEACRSERGYALATLEIVAESAAWSCAECDVPIAPGAALRCACGGAARLVAGGDLILQRVELEVRDV
jgi:hydrogenase nickel incorporation protein HypA/HybF